MNLITLGGEGRQVPGVEAAATLVSFTPQALEVLRRALSIVASVVPPIDRDSSKFLGKVDMLQQELNQGPL